MPEGCVARAMSSWTIDPCFETKANAGVLDFLRRRNPSAHSDVSEELIRSASGIAGVETYCPDPSRYAFVVLYRTVDRTIVGLAFGMSGLAFRLPEDQVPAALEEGGIATAEMGSGWVRLEPWTAGETLGESRCRLARWCTVAAGY